MLKRNILYLALVGNIFFLTQPPVKAAEKVILKYRFLRESVSVPELTTFAETGELSSSLDSILVWQIKSLMI